MQDNNDMKLGALLTEVSELVHIIIHNPGIVAFAKVSVNVISPL